MVNSSNSTQSVVKAQKISMVNGQMLKRAGQSIDLAVVAAVTMESMGVTSHLMYIHEYLAIPI